MDWSASDIPDQSGRTAVVTGANSGIGYETALALARKGARVVLACRDRAAGAKRSSACAPRAPAADARFVPLDLGSLASVAEFAKRIESEETKLDLLCNNAGVMVPPYGTTADGFELQFGTNHLGHFALTGRLLPLLLRRRRARVVTVSSTAHRMGRSTSTTSSASEALQREARLRAEQAREPAVHARARAPRRPRASSRWSRRRAHPGSTHTEPPAHSGFSRCGGRDRLARRRPAARCRRSTRRPRPA